MSVLDADIASFERMRPQLEAEHHLHWVVFRQGGYVASYPDFEAAAEAASDMFETGPYLIRQVGAPSQVQLPGGMVFTHAHAVSLSGH